LTGVSTEGFTNEAMRWGTETEPQARSAYEFYRDIDVTQVAFVNHPSIADTGASPDGLVGDDGLVEIKCPNTATHIETLVGKAVPQKYVTQIQWQLACTGRQWCDFVSFDPRMPESMQFFCVRVHRVPEIIEELEKEVIAFLNEIRAKISTLRKIYDPDMQPVEGAAAILMAG
jgi:putative phage-type endonuclease